MSSNFEVIASREYRSVEGGVKISVEIGRPDYQKDSTDFYCEFRIKISDEVMIRKIMGLDAFQALNLTIKVIDAELRRIVRSKKLKLQWDGGEFSDLMFPE